MFAYIAAIIAHFFLPDLHSQKTIFYQWKHTHNKNYPSQQLETYRFNVFLQNLHIITNHNLKHSLGQENYQLELNQFADLTQEEFAHLYLQEDTEKQQITRSCDGKITPVDNPPESVDWTSTAVTRIKNQGQCGSCWSFSTTGGLEGLYSIKMNRMKQFSEKQLMDCSKAYGNNGCNGGLATQGFQYVIDEGITTQDMYPYKPEVGLCKYSSTMKVFQIKQCAQVPRMSQSSLMSAVVKQPVSIGVRADQSGFRFYKSGVFDGQCGYQHNHAILLVGYGKAEGKKYWKCKNSWGESWGNKGYINLVRNGDGYGQCGIQTQPSVPLL